MIDGNFGTNGNIVVSIPFLHLPLHRYAEKYTVKSVLYLVLYLLATSNRRKLKRLAVIDPCKESKLTSRCFLTFKCQKRQLKNNTLGASDNHSFGGKRRLPPPSYIVAYRAYVFLNFLLLGTKNLNFLNKRKS